MTAPDPFSWWPCLAMLAAMTMAYGLHLLIQG